jgi:hypothetical protein
MLRANGTPYSYSEYRYVGQVSSSTGIWSLLKISAENANIWSVLLALALLEVCRALVVCLRNRRRRRIYTNNKFEYKSRSRAPTLTDEEEEEEEEDGDDDDEDIGHLELL